MSDYRTTEVQTMPKSKHKGIRNSDSSNLRSSAFWNLYSEHPKTERPKTGKRQNQDTFFPKSLVFGHFFDVRSPNEARSFWALRVINFFNKTVTKAKKIN